MTKLRPPDTPGWIVVGGRSEGMELAELPVDIWTVDWHSTGAKVLVSDPLYGVQRALTVVEIDSGDGTITFAVDEVSNGVYLFALPATL